MCAESALHLYSRRPQHPAVHEQFHSCFRHLVPVQCQTSAPEHYYSFTRAQGTWVSLAMITGTVRAQSARAHRAQSCELTVPCTSTVADPCNPLCTNNFVRSRPSNLGITRGGHQHGPCTDHIVHRVQPCALTGPCTHTVATPLHPTVHEQYNSFTPKEPGYH